ncbi:DarT ssDNA thymidine ADP-ribosyltransferase family protein [Laspinema sp. D1]|uniref:DarT ssDNA thymidine ADP-ribosyltransferase family protein n=1 Tax=Laspinema palackyanum D2a TaxID=2953684 RepID=A0ABT2N178_9CYAN|nr:DarT ssDNA thymidine ADP-ribosyltransferase family protein [Laspinema sp. D2a]
MSKTALFKGWGTKQQDEHYKILECEDGECFAIHHSEIHLAEELKQGRFITFDIQGNEAKNLRPLREVGVIDSWNRKKYFGSAKILRNDAKFLQLFERSENGTAEVFFYINEATSGSQDIKRGDLVVFDIRKTYRRDQNKYRDDALNLKLLSPETDLEIIDNCVKSDNINVLLAVLRCSLNNSQYDRVVYSIAHIIANCSVLDKISLTSKLPEQIKENEKIITFLSDEKKLEFWIKQLNNPEQYEGAMVKITELLQGFTDTKRSSLLSIIPETAKQHPNIFAFLSNDEKLEFWIKQLNNPEEYKSAIKHIAELLQACADTKRSSLLSIVPGTATQHPKLFAFLVNKKKLEVWVKELKNFKEYESAIEQILKLLQGGFDNKQKQSSVTGKIIPLKNKQDTTIFSFLSDDEKIDFFVSQLQNPESYESAINGIAKILDQYPQKKSQSSNDVLNFLYCLLEDSKKNKFKDSNKSYDDFLRVINKLPESAKKHEKLFKYLPPEEKIKILSGALLVNLSKIETVISHYSLSNSERKSLIYQLPDWVKKAPSLQEYQVKIPPVCFRPDAAEAQQIRAFVAERGIEKIVHITRLSNLQNICDFGGILSLHHLDRHGIENNPFDGSKPEGIKYKNYVNCSLTYYNFFMLYGLVHKSSDKVVLFHIKTDFLWKRETEFCEFNAATNSGIHIESGWAKFQRLFKDEVTDRQGTQDRSNKPKNLPTCIQSEILIHDGIHIDDIVEVVVRNQLDIPSVRQSGWKGNVRCEPNLFQYRNEWYNRMGI